MPVNKIGLTEEQQKLLTRVIQIAAQAATVTTAVLAHDGAKGEAKKKAAAEKIVDLTIEQANLAQLCFLGGPEEVTKRLNEICQFCDLPGVITCKTMEGEHAF